VGERNRVEPSWPKRWQAGRDAQNQDTSPSAHSLDTFAGFWHAIIALMKLRQEMRAKANRVVIKFGMGLLTDAQNSSP